MIRLSPSKSSSTTARASSSPSKSQQSPTVLFGSKERTKKTRAARTRLFFWLLNVSLAIVILPLFYLLGLRLGEVGVEYYDRWEDDSGEPTTKRRLRRELPHAANEVWPKPDGWEGYGFGKIRRHFMCKDYAHDITKPLPTMEDWQLFRDKYKEVVDNTISFDDTMLPTHGYSISEKGQPPPYYAKSGSRGRGLFASRDIKKGDFIHDGSKGDVLFPTGMSWRKYIFSLPRNKACDMIDWTWTQRVEEGGPIKVYSAINISILCNGGNKKNVNIPPKSGTSAVYYAVKDIKKDEELLTDYSIFETNWAATGL